jgi:zinc/manganese transport system substrate-binding protein
MAPQNTSGIQVVAAENFWGDIATQLGGPYVHVTSLVTNPNADPHLYESNARNASVVSSAGVVIINGLGYDDFMGKLLGASSRPGRQVVTAQQVLHAREGSNQHLWYDIPHIHEVASRITNVYITEDPDHKTIYQHNLMIFDQSLQPLLQTIAQIKQTYGGTPVAYTEPVPAYVLTAAGLQIATPEGFAKSIEDGDDPSPTDTNAMDSLIISRAIKVLLYNAQATSPVTERVKTLAAQNGIPVIGVTETLPGNGETYQTWQANQLHELQAALATTP